MRPALQQLLYDRYPALYRQKNEPPTKSTMYWGFEHHDGWFAIIDALSKTITGINPKAEARQVKEKLGSLSFYCQASEPAIYAAISAAGAFSTRVCEVTGEIGALLCIDGWFAVRSAGQIAELRQAKDPSPKSMDLIAEDDRGPGLPPTLNERLSFSKEEAIATLRRQQRLALANTKQIDFPPRLFDLVYSAVRTICLSHTEPAVTAPIRIDRISWTRTDGLKILPSFRSIQQYAVAALELERKAAAIDAEAEGAQEHKIEDNRIKAWSFGKNAPASDSQQRGAIDDFPEFNNPVARKTEEIAYRALAVTKFAKEISLRMDLRTGRIGPVDDEGNLISPDEPGPDEPDTHDNMYQVRDLLNSFDPQLQYRPTIFCRNHIKPTLQAHRLMAHSLQTGFAKILLPKIYSKQLILFPIPAYDPVAHQIAFALADQRDWRIAFPVEMSQFFMGRASRPKMEELQEFFYDQPDEIRFDITPSLTLRPVQDKRVFELTAVSQAIFQHIHTNPDASDRELLADARFAAASWIGEPSMQEALTRDLNAGRLRGREIYLAQAILWSAQADQKALDHAPAGFDPAEHEARAARIYGWSIETNHLGNLYLRADRIENHTEIPDNRRLAYSTALVWHDLKLGWARTRSRFYRLMKDE